MECFKQAFSQNVIPIVFCCNDNYIKYLSVAIQSIIENSNNKYNYDIFVFYSKLEIDNLNLIKSQFLKLKNFSCRFVNVSKFITNLYLREQGQFTKETYYRFLILDLLKQFNKVIYLDCDLVIDDDISKLYNIDISKYYLGACRDIMGIGFSHLPYGFVRKHQYKKLKMKNYLNYFNSGVLLINTAEMNKDFDWYQELESHASKNYAWLDQDILNILCEKKVKLLDDRWNMTLHPIFKFDIRFSKREFYKKWLISVKHPAIYHYAGGNHFKPWINPFNYPSSYFWRYASRSPFFKIILEDLINRTKSNKKKKKIIKKINGYIS